jgi:acetoin:2,6-dichlorophenolindophenol oxidoreductase subunit beta
MTTRKYWQAINAAMAEELRRDETVVLIGEDVGEPGGPFGATAGLWKEFGASRVRDTPISEATLTGIGVGAAMAGLKPVVEIMFLDFITLAMDQLANQAAKMSYMSVGHYSVPLTIRTMCGARRGTGPQHGQNLESWLAAVPGLKVVWGGTPEDAKGLLKSAIRDPDPVVVIESMALWSVRSEVPDGADVLVPLGQAKIRRSGADITIICYGATVPLADEAAGAVEQDGIDVEVLDLRTLSPLDTVTILDSLEKTGRLVIVQDASGPCSVGAEVAKIAATLGFSSLRAPVEFVQPPAAPVPFSPALERAYFPQTADIVAAVRQSMNK